MEIQKTPILIGCSGAAVVRLEDAEGRVWIEKSGEVEQEGAVLAWCQGRLPVPQILSCEPGLLRMSVVPGVDLTELPWQTSVAVLVEALEQIHALPVAGCPFSASWELRLREAEERLAAGLVDDCSPEVAAAILKELHALPPLPDVVCFTHGDACLPNFLAAEGRLSGMVDLGRAGLTHPAQDWALALRSVRSDFGLEAEEMLLAHVPAHCRDEQLLYRFRMLDELF
ncbi:aminoglycoside 3'-phosphotransferase [Bryobacter aggregatus]|uniref:aminoglycoside 3'-phosphotransferase n=1 Tax=Bryobacter aggregatus TaxID=360054 RepID=UPI00068B72A9|nr:aminoglycoside 3'-phosphotransferase [Bryobacter aggregatus]